MESRGERRARAAAWRTPAELLRLIARDPDSTRAALTRRLRLSSGSAAEVTARLRAANLVAEEVAPSGGRGRPTTVLRPHPAGPLVLAIDVRHEDWRCAVAGIDARPEPVAAGTHDQDPAAVVATLVRAVGDVRRRYGERLRVVSVAIAGTVRHDRLVQASTLGWGPVDFGALVPGDGPHAPDLLVGNDATLSGVAEARTGAARDVATVLHLIVEVGVGGAVIVDGRPATGTTGAAGEFGHMPFGEAGQRCPCGASACWDLEVDGRAIARELGLDAPRDPRSFVVRAVERMRGDPATADAVAAAATALARGIAGLVNATDAGAVTIGGLAPMLRRACPEAFARAYDGGLMLFHRGDPPPVVDARHGEDGALYGAVAVGLDRLTSIAGLTAWVDLLADPGS